MLTNPATANFTLMAGSPCIKAGYGGVDLGAVPYEATQSSLSPAHPTWRRLQVSELLPAVPEKLNIAFPIDPMNKRSVRVAALNFVIPAVAQLSGGICGRNEMLGAPFKPSVGLSGIRSCPGPCFSSEFSLGDLQ